MQKQICFNSDTAKMFYFSPYIDIFELNDTKILLKRYDSGKQIMISCSTANALKMIILGLLQGISKNQLIQYMGSEMLLELCIKNGVIE
ncbi:MAG: hypothetical protein IKJ01_03735 [Lachnospiraceae bacterium]|nr:hypothetical protein [Lachnospiraceae bacterium]